MYYSKPDDNIMLNSIFYIYMKVIYGILINPTYLVYSSGFIIL